MRRFSVLVGFITLCTSVLGFPSYGSLAGLSRAQLEEILPRLEYSAPQSPPGPLTDTSPKLVNDKDHPWMPLRPGDIRGPCPGLNTLASHGWLPRNGIATPVQIIDAVQQGLNMENKLAIFVTYAAHLVDGNLITDLLSIGSKTNETGPDPPAPATVGGLNTHAVFEGDTSMTRADAYFGNNHDFNETLFDEFSYFSKKYGGGKYNMTAAAELRYQRIQDSISTNPTFSFVLPRYFTAYLEATFPIKFFIDGRQGDGQLDLTVARGFFQDSRMPDDFHRANGTKGLEGMGAISLPHPVHPGGNMGKVNSYTPDLSLPDFPPVCMVYESFLNETVKFYPNPDGKLRESLKINLNFMFQGVDSLGCRQIFPYGY